MLEALDTEKVTQAYQRDGFAHVTHLFESRELQPLQETLQESRTTPSAFTTVGPLDYIGWTDPADDLLGRLCRVARVVELASALIGEACYHYHSKIVRKPAKRSAALDWHQDYGSWYKDGCLRPDLLTVVVALTPSTEQNGCLRFMRGSHRMGRLDRLQAGHDSYSYFSLSEARLAAIEKRFDVVSPSLDVGDALVFHANTLHASGPNVTTDCRTLLEMSYNAVSNAPVFDHQEHHRVRRMSVVDDEAVQPDAYRSVCGATRLVDLNDDNDPGIGVFRRRYDTGQC